MEKYVSLAEETAKKISDMVKDGIYPPAKQLPNETELANILGVSRTSIREAVKILITSNVLVIKRGVGTFVCEVPNSNYDPFNIAHSSDRRRDAIEALELRLLIEPAMIEDIFHTATEEELEEIYRIETLCKEKILAGEDYKELDLNFHEAIAKAAHNSIYEKLVPLLHYSILIIQHSAKDINKSAEFGENASIYHEKIVDCIRKKDIFGARLFSEIHIYNALQLLNKQK